ncbi:MAG: hypothetical protein ACK2TZ_03725 [Anaerolineales bacterium]
MTKLSTWLQRISATWLMVGTLLIMIAFMVFVLPGQSAAASQISDGAGSPDLSFFYSPAELTRMASDYGVQGRQAYIKARWSFDLVFPLVYASFLTIGISWFLNRLEDLPAAVRLANLVPILGGIFDLLENTGASLTMALYPSQPPIWLILASAATPVKWVLVAASFILYFVLGAALLIKQLQTRRG